MAGGLMQLVAYGAQDIYLTGNPQITMFKVVYRRHTNFAIEAIENTFNGQADFGKRVTATISRNGDLITRVYLQVDLPTLTHGTGIAWVHYIGHVLIKEVEVQIGGQRIDKHYGDWLTIWSELTLKEEQRVGYFNMIGEVSTLYSLDTTVDGQTLYIPLQFWFNNNPGLALPLIALQYHEVKIEILFRPWADCYVSTDGLGPASTPQLGAASLWVDYIYLDTDERRRFAQVSHEYLVEQLQFTGDESFNQTNVKIRMNFNHPTKELIWVCQRDSRIDGATAKNIDGNNWSDYTDDRVGFEGANTVVDAKIQLNGHDRMSVRASSYFNLVQPFQHHTRVPSNGIYVYSFALNPEEHQPSGTVNFSRIDNATLLLTLASNDAQKVRIYARNYNVLRIMSGMGGLGYSN